MISDYQIAGLKVVRPKIFSDNRGYFFEKYNSKTFRGLGIKDTFVQDNMSFSERRGTVRGLHLQAPPHAQGKLVSVISGAVFDVAVDVRHDSATYGKWAGIELSASNNLQFWIPPGFLHGFQTLQPKTLVTYKCSGYYNKEGEMGVRFDDPVLSIDWPIKKNIVLSEKDSELPFSDNFQPPF